MSPECIPFLITIEERNSASLENISTLLMRGLDVRLILVSNVCKQCRDVSMDIAASKFDGLNDVSRMMELVDLITNMESIFKQKNQLVLKK